MKTYKAEISEKSKNLLIAVLLSEGMDSERKAVSESELSEKGLRSIEADYDRWMKVMNAVERRLTLIRQSISSKERESMRFREVSYAYIECVDELNRMRDTERRLRKLLEELKA